jgi:hypothetical protein
MKELNFSKNSWHYKLAKLGEYNEYRPDFCHYVRSAIFGGIIGLMFLFVGTMMMFFLGDFFAYLAAMVTTGLWFNLDPHLGAQVIIGLLLIATAIGCLISFHYFKEKRREAKQQKLWEARERGEEIPEPKPSFIATAYTSLKDKTCFRVRFE